MRLTALGDFSADGRQLDEDNVSEARLGVIRDGHGARHSAVIENNRLMIRGVPLRCGQ